MKRSSLIFVWVTVDSEENSAPVLWGSSWVFFQDLLSSSLDCYWQHLISKLSLPSAFHPTLFKTNCHHDNVLESAAHSLSARLLHPLWCPLKMCCGPREFFCLDPLPFFLDFKDIDKTSNQLHVWQHNVNLWSLTKPNDQMFLPYFSWRRDPLWSSGGLRPVPVVIVP